MGPKHRNFFLADKERIHFCVGEILSYNKISKGKVNLKVDKNSIEHQTIKPILLKESFL